jgi:N-acetylmuramoyl-L-alanine amidase
LTQWRAAATLAAVTALVTVLVGTVTLEAGPAEAAHDFRVRVEDDGGLVRLPLAGRLVVIDPGHQLGNHNFPAETDRPVPSGGFTKPCNTTGTATDGGYPEATFTWRVAKVLERRLVGLGATVMLTRHSNRQDRWGPCVDVRGRDGNKRHADLKISIHGDGSYAAGARGFHVIAPTDRRPWTHDIFKPSRRLARVTRSALEHVGLRVANYIAGGDGLDFRSDLGTINLSNMPTVMVELGNMRDPKDARQMTSKAGRARDARGLAHAVRRFLR